MSSSSAAPRPRAIPTLRQRKHATTTVATHDDDDARGQHEIPLPDRAPFSRWRTFAITFAFFAFLFPIHCAQLFFYPMSYVPGGIRELYWVGVRSSLNTFARCIVWISGQTTLVITADDSVDLDTVVKKDKDSGKLMLNLASHAVYMSNHQMYADWCYIFSFLYLADFHGSLVIILKASLKHIPMAGPAMRLWHFIFLSNWSSDRQPTGETLFELGRRATRHKRPLSLLVYPEGTLVSALTRPKSAAYAEKLGVPDMKNQLLPRSTGLLFSLRTLALNVPDLVLYDLTVGYPGLPAAAYAQTYYSLQSIYTAHQGPPTVHIHLRQYDLANVPIGTVPQLPSVGGGVKQEGYVSPVELDERLTAEERKTFDEWVRARWTEKDLLLDQFYESGEFPCRDGQRKEIRFELRGFDDYMSMASNYAAVWVMYKMIRYSFKYAPFWYAWVTDKALSIVS